MSLSALSNSILFNEVSGEPARGRASSKLPRSASHPHMPGGPSAAGRTFQARDELVYALRRVTPADVGPLNVFLYRLSDRARRMRFMTGRPCTPQFVREQVGRMLAGAAGDAITLIATDARGGPGSVVGVAELACDRASGTGEVGIVVLDDAQRKGIGSQLARQLLQAARELGITELHGDMYAENRAIQRLVHGLGLPFTTTIEAGEMHVVVRVPG
jgi:RimJ/RimL family protein N-acetyltransferase